jgi:hypothetical protein
MDPSTSLIEDVKDVITNLMHEVQLVIPDATKEVRFKWCVDFARKQLSETQLSALFAYAETHDGEGGSDLISWYTMRLWKVMFNEIVEYPVERTRSQLVDVASVLHQISKEDTNVRPESPELEEGVPCLDTLHVEDDTEQDVLPPSPTPAVEVVEEATPAVEVVEEATPAVEVVEEATPAVEVVEEATPAVEVVEEAISAEEVTIQEETVEEESVQPEEDVLPKKRGRKPKKV